jgi:hypothetical protein
MKVRVNRELFTTTSFDSGSLTVLASVLHPFKEGGEYVGEVYRDDLRVGRFHILVGENCVGRQVNIDLREQDRRLQRTSTGYQDCYQLQINGVAVFYVSKGKGGYYVTVRKLGEEGRKYSTRMLEEDDVFAVNLMRPGEYRIITDPGQEGEIVVNYREPTGKPYRPGDPIEVSIEGGGIKPRRLEITPLQALIHRIQRPSRIKIDLVKPINQPDYQQRKED